MLSPLLETVHLFFDCNSTLISPTSKTAAVFHASDFSTLEAKAENSVYEASHVHLSRPYLLTIHCPPKWKDLPPDIFIGTVVTLKAILGRAHIFMIWS